MSDIVNRPTVSLELLNRLRQHALAAIEKDQDYLSRYYKEDLERLRNDDSWVERFYFHRKEDFDNASTMIVQCLAMRKTNKTLELTLESFNNALLTSGIVFMQGKDIHGNRLTWLRVKKFKRGEHAIEDIKKCVIYVGEEAEKVFPYVKTTLVIDLTGAGISNVDLDVGKLFIKLGMDFYPSVLVNVICLNVAWIFSGIRLLIKLFSLEDYVKFSYNESILDFVARDQLPPYMRDILAIKT